MAEFLAILTGVFKFWDETKWFIQKIQGTPAENREKIIASIHKAFEKAEALETKDDTSEIEDVISS